MVSNESRSERFDRDWNHIGDDRKVRGFDQQSEDRKNRDAPGVGTVAPPETIRFLNLTETPTNEYSPQEGDFYYPNQPIYFLNIGDPTGYAIKFDPGVNTPTLRYTLWVLDGNGARADNSLEVVAEASGAYREDEGVVYNTNYDTPSDLSIEEVKTAFTEYGITFLDWGWCLWINENDTPISISKIPLEDVPPV